MQVNFRKNSWHFKYYSLVFNNPPKSLCPYWWTLVFMTIFSPFILFIALIGKLIDLYEKWSDKRPNPTEEQRRKKIVREEKIQRIGNVVGKVLLGLLISAIVICLGLVFYDTSLKIGWFQVIVNILAFIGGITLFALTIWTIMEYELFPRMANKIKNWSVFIMIKGMIYATYTKACPKINWTDDLEISEK